MPRDVEKKRAYDKVYRQVNKEKIKVYARKYAKAHYWAHREEVLAYARVQHAIHREDRLKYGRAYYDAHKEELHKKANEKTEWLRLEVLAQYSITTYPKCSHCSIIDTDVLCIDHINNDGAEHRKAVGEGTNLYRWLKRNGYPKGYQTLCYNCNMKKQRQALKKLATQSSRGESTSPIQLENNNKEDKK